MRWLRNHWKATAVGIFLFLVGIGIGAAGAEDPAGDPAAIAVETEEETPDTVTETVEGESDTVTVTKTVEPKAATTIPGDGTFLVGEDIRPGTYRTAGGSCYWARLKGTSGELDDVIANGNVTGPTTVTIAPSDDAFQTSGCEDWQLR
jgi:hypothetical protein